MLPIFWIFGLVIPSEKMHNDLASEYSSKY